MTDIFPERPGLELQKRLKKAGMTQIDFARKINVSHSCINEIISGKRKITVVAAQKIADYFGEEPSYWLNKQSDYFIYLNKHSLPL